MGAPVRVAIIDDDGAFRQTVRGWFEGMDDVLIVGDVQSGPEIPSWLRQVVQPDVVLLDIAAAPAAQVRAVAAYTRVLVLHTAGQEALVLDALRAGALGHLDKQNTSPTQAIAAVRAVSRGEAVLSPELAGRIVDEVAERYRRNSR
ncbi:MAG: hypothetical protein N2508_08180 [Anaerolineae bacterium]|nr:hypothetical protein [Anaerolineae bacterium]